MHNKLSEEYINWLIRNKLLKVIYINKELRKKTEKNIETWKRWDFVINEFIFLRTMDSFDKYKEHNGYHIMTKEDIEKYRIFIADNIINYVLKKNVGLQLDPERLIKIIAYLINMKFKIIKLSNNNKIDYDDNYIQYRDIKIKLDDRLRQLIKLGGVENCLIMLLRYMGLGINGHHCAIPINTYEYLYNTFNIRREGYASPLNSKLLKWNDTKFCSLFYDTDKYFGSMGPFNWKTVVKYQDKNWTVNPPYIESIMDVMYDNVIKAFNEITNPDFLLMILIPKWESNIVYSNLATNKSGLVIYIYEPLENEHYMNCNGHVIKMKGVQNCMFFLSKNKNLNIENKMDELKKIWNTYEDTGSTYQSNFVKPEIINKKH